MLVLSLATGALPPVQAQEPTNSSVSATAPSDKGGQVVSIDGKNMSFAEIAGLPAEQQDAIIGKMTGKDKIFYGRWQAQSANQRIEIKKRVEQSAHQVESTIDANIQSANQRIDNKKEALNQLQQMQEVMDEIGKNA